MRGLFIYILKQQMFSIMLKVKIEPSTY